MGYRAGVSCSNGNCWNVRGLNRYADVPAAILAAGVLAAGRCSLDDKEVPDLAALAGDLEANDSKQAKLVKGALKWIGLSTESMDEEISPYSLANSPSESVRRLRQIAAELLDSIKA